ncbi:hypothetical protein [Archangium sp.]|uniref:hypothetical protein n=1 Tax=Archangium sp. TaxID=1872627 RepID=UPI00389A48FE
MFKRVEFEPAPLRFYVGSIALLVLGVALAFAGLLVAHPLLFLLGLPPAGVGLGILVRRSASRCGLTVHEQGVVLSRIGSDEIIPYLHMRDFSLKEEAKLFNGNHAGLLRTLDFTWSGGNRRAAQFASADAEDFFAPMLVEMLGKLADAAEARLQKGAPLEGKGWRLDSRGLHVGEQAPVQLSKLAGVAMFENKVSFWRSGEELPFLTVEEESPNARLLGVLARRQRTEDERPQRAGALGRVLFQKKVTRASQVACWIGAGLCFIAGSAGIITTAMAHNWGWLAGSLFVGWGAALAFAAIAQYSFRVHELGVVRRSIFGERTLRYSEITSFQFGATRHYHNGAYTGTALNMSFTGGPGTKPISHNQTSRGNDSDLDALREQVADIVAAQLLQRLERGEEIQWGPSARFTRNGLMVRAPKLFGKGEERRAPYDAGLHISIQQGTLQLFINNEAKAVMSCPCAADNFYPGLTMLGVLIARAKGSRQAAV